MKDIKVIIATHKPYKMPTDEMYLPIHVGHAGKKDIGYTPDDTLDNISEKNAKYCELTGLYWAWKNLDAEYIGLSHYRRHFKGKNKSKDKFECVLTKEEASNIFESTNIILPKKRKYYIENLYNHYKHTLYIEPLDKTREILEAKYPNYLKEFDRLKKRTSAHMFNMLIMKKEELNDYCSFLFDVLFELEKVNEFKEYDAFHNRFYGRISELLLDVWLYTNKKDYKEVPFVYMENTNWYKKGTSFLKAKFMNKKYKGSF